jgi:putative DNA primase/helicase
MLAVVRTNYIKEDGTKRFARESRKHGCFHVIGAANPAEGLQKLANSPVIAIAEGYATAATVAKYGNVPAIAAFDAGKPADDLANFPRQQCRSVCARR